MQLFAKPRWRNLKKVANKIENKASIISIKAERYLHKAFQTLTEEI